MVRATPGKPRHWNKTQMTETTHNLNAVRSAFVNGYQPQFGGYKPAERVEVLRFSTVEKGLALPLHGQVVITSAGLDGRLRTEWLPSDGKSGYVAWQEHNHVSINQSHRSALNALMQYVSGSMWGSPKLVITVPAAKLAGRASTGRAGYVRGDYDQPVSYTAPDGTVRMVGVSNQHLPKQRESNVWRQLHLVTGELVAYTDEVDLLPGVKDDFGAWWKAYVGSEILAGYPISIDCPNFIEKDLLAIVANLMGAQNQQEIANADRGRRYEDRVDYRLYVEGKEDTAVAEKLARMGEAAPSKSSDFIVHTTAGGVLDLSVWPVSTALFIVREDDRGNVTHSQYRIPSNSEQGRKTAAKKLNDGGWKVDLH